MTEHSTEFDRGTALGVYAAAGSIGGAVAPFILGVVADTWGLPAVFRSTGALVLVGISVLWYMDHRRPRRALRALGDECRTVYAHK